MTLQSAEALYKHHLASFTIGDLSNQETHIASTLNQGTIDIMLANRNDSQELEGLLEAPEVPETILPNSWTNKGKFNKDKFVDWLCGK